MQKGEYFTGIFYAHAPIFKLPIKAPPLQGIIDATIWSDGCPNARNLGIGQFCTRLNVYRCGPPENDTLYPVLVYFPGLDFSWQNNAHLDPAVIIPKIACNGLVFVTADYRVGPYGFFTTHDEIAPGNLGLYDTKAALEWVYENIVYFGGNPSQVTVMGSRLGADLVSLLSLQPETAQLFQQSILISGSAFVPSLIADGAREESAMKKFFDPSKEFAVEIECATDDRWAKGINDSSAIFECIRDLKDRRIPIAEAVKRMNPRAWIKWPLFVDGKLVKNSSENIQITHKTMPTLIGLCPANMARKVNLRKEDIFSRLDIVQDLWNLNRSDIYFTHYADLLSDFKTIGTEESKQTQLSALVNQVILIKF
uniref:Carboxylesterase type B domain-containing protein n=1 Tax=Acrobeloides nanus TaxID=290746 RepID=A0A914BZ40_9BILA